MTYSYLHPHPIICVSDILEIVQQPSTFLEGILDSPQHASSEVSPLGRSDAGYPRPFPYGIWFRGQTNSNWELEPAAFRTGHYGISPEYYDERNMFHDLKSRTMDFNSADYSNFDIMCMMRHHTLPTRVMDWSENILIAAFFAIQSSFKRYFNSVDPNTNIIVHDKDGREIPDPAIYIVNTYRLNKLSSLMNLFAENYEPGILVPDDIDVVFRAACAEHSYYEDVIANLLGETRDRTHNMLSHIFYQEIENYLESSIPDDFYRISRRPVGVMPKRANPRMDSQLSTFTIHGGKINYFNTSIEREKYKENPRKINIPSRNYSGNLKFLDKPEKIEFLNESQPLKFLKKFVISRFAIKRVMIELDRIGVSEPMLFPEMDNQAEFVKRRWSVIGSERRIQNLPRISRGFNERSDYAITKDNAEKELYG